ncbi:hypothetical protein Tco_0475136 [Tanacetum coccineum]
MLSNFFQMQNPSGSGSLPSNTVVNPRGDVKSITTRSGVAYDGPSMPPIPSPPPKEVERETEVTKDKDVHAKESPISSPDPITSPSILTPSPILPPSLLFDPRYFFIPEELLPPKKQICSSSSSSTTLSNFIHKMYLKHHEKQVEDILNYLDELHLHRIERMEEERTNGKELKTELKRIRTQIIKLQKKKLGQKDKIAFAHYRISNLELIIKEIQARHQTDQEDL